MTLSWLEIGTRFPDAVVLWDRDVAPTLDWEPRFRTEQVKGEPGCWFDLVLWADAPDCRWNGCSCRRCLRWSGEQWLRNCDWPWETHPLPNGPGQPATTWPAHYWSAPGLTTARPGEWRREHLGQWAEPVTRVDDLVEDFRVQLGLLPWDVHAARAGETARNHERVSGFRVDHGRRSGRTMHGLLRSIARAVLGGYGHLTIVGADDAATDYSVRMANDIIDRLGIQGIVIRRDARNRRNGRPGVVYRDHHLDKR